LLLSFSAFQFFVAAVFRFYLALAQLESFAMLSKKRNALGVWQF